MPAQTHESEFQAQGLCSQLELGIFFLLFLATLHSMWNFPNQGSNPHPL